MNIVGLGADEVARELASSEEELLRKLLAIVFDREQAMRLLGTDVDASVLLWPGSVYRSLAAVALRSESVWRRCARQLDCALGSSDVGPPTHAQNVREGCDCMSWDEVAAQLWSRLRRVGSPQSMAS